MARVTKSESERNSKVPSQGRGQAALTKAITEALDADQKLREDRRRMEEREEIIRGRVLWRDSHEYQRMTRWQLAVCLPLTAALVIVGYLAGAQGWLFPEGLYAPAEFRWSVVGVALAVVLGYGGMGLFLYRQTRQRYFVVRQRLGLANKLEDREREIAESGQALDLASLWAITQQRIEYYHQIATSQSESSFRSGTIASFAGFVLLLIVGVVGAFSTSLTASIAVGAVGAAGAAMAAFLGSTFMKTQAASTEQLRQFFIQPVEFSRVLAAERLIESLPAGDRAESVKLVLASMLGPSGPPKPQGEGA